MKTLVVVENPDRWQFAVQGVEVVPAKAYLFQAEYAELRRAAVFNLCRQHGYQRLGYYVSLLGVARGHRVLPSVETVQALRSAAMVRSVSDELDDMIQRTLAPLRSDTFDLSIYFGLNVAKRYDRLSRSLFNQFPVPFFKATFARRDRWKLQSIRPLAIGEVPSAHHDFVVARVADYFARPVRAPRPQRAYRYDLAILHNPDETDAPSDPSALRRFVRAARSVGMDAALIDADDYGRIPEFDALFIRETTAVNHHTYRFAQRATAEGLVVIDDPRSIVRCTNKVYQAELFARHDIPVPKTVVVHRENVAGLEHAVGLPCVLKRPDSSFSAGVVRVSTADELASQTDRFFETSELVLAQEFVPSSFDWRVGVLAGRPLFACQYHMARGHWQVVARREGGAHRYGKVETLAVEDAPPSAIELAVRAARLFGEGLYGVDLKEVDGRFVVIEVNDNPNVDHGWEDRVMGEELYRAIMQEFRDRLDARGDAIGNGRDQAAPL